MREAAARKEKIVSFRKLVGHQESLKQCVEQCKAAITYPGIGLPILLQGQTGTGKSYIAQLTYEYSVEKGILDKKGSFVTVNCAEYANNPELFLTNLFGYKKGSYTGAEKDKAGLLALADGGVLFLDEIHALKPECQEKIFLFMDKGIYHMAVSYTHLDVYKRQAYTPCNAAIERYCPRRTERPEVLRNIQIDWRWRCLPD